MTFHSLLTQAFLWISPFHRYDFMNLITHSCEFHGRLPQSPHTTIFNESHYFSHKHSPLQVLPWISLAPTQVFLQTLLTLSPFFFSLLTHTHTHKQKTNPPKKNSDVQQLYTTKIKTSTFYTFTFNQFSMWKTNHISNRKPQPPRKNEPMGKGCFHPLLWT